MLDVCVAVVLDTVDFVALVAVMLVRVMLLVVALVPVTDVCVMVV